MQIDKIAGAVMNMTIC